MKYPKGSIVKSPSQRGLGVVVNVFAMPDERFRYGVQWDGGAYEVYEAREIAWATVDHPKIYGSLV